MENTIRVHWHLTPIQLQFKLLLQWTPLEKNPIYTNFIQLQQCGCCPFIPMRVLKPHNVPYYMEIDSDTSEFVSLYDTLSKHYKSLKPATAFKKKLEELLDYLEEEQ